MLLECFCCNEYNFAFCDKQIYICPFFQLQIKEDSGKPDVSFYRQNMRMRKYNSVKVSKKLRNTGLQIKAAFSRTRKQLKQIY